MKIKIAKCGPDPWYNVADILSVTVRTNCLATVGGGGTAFYRSLVMDFAAMLLEIRIAFCISDFQRRKLHLTLGNSCSLCGITDFPAIFIHHK